MSGLLIRRRAVDGGIHHIEALGSWLLRLAHANGYRSVGSLCSGERLGIKSRWAFDAGISDETLASVARLTLADAGSLERLTLRDSLVNLTGSSSGGRGVGGAKGRWLLRTPSSVNGVRYSICCDCMHDDGVPFVRVDWRLSISCWCRSHRCELLEACPSCGAAFILSASRTAPIFECETCHLNFTLAPHEKTLANDRDKRADAKPAPAGLATWLATDPAQLEAADFPVPVAFSHLWWDGVRILLELCGRPVPARMLLRMKLEASAQEALQHVASHTRVDFDRQPTKVRAGLLDLVTEMTESWPHRFIEILGQANITRSQFATTELSTPSWLAKVCDEHLCRKSYALTTGEARTAIALLQRHSPAVSKRSIKALLGVTESKALDAIRSTQKNLTLVQLGRVVRALDHEIRLTSAARDQQASALRDACCVAAATWHGISFESAAKLPLLSGSAMLTAWDTHLASSEEQALIVERFKHWIELYLRGVRPRFERASVNGTHLFLTRFGKPYKGFGVAAIFARVLRESGVEDWGRGARLLVGTPLATLSGRAPSIY